MHFPTYSSCYDITCKVHHPLKLIRGLISAGYLTIEKVVLIMVATYHSDRPNMAPSTLFRWFMSLKWKVGFPVPTFRCGIISQNMVPGIPLGILSHPGEKQEQGLIGYLYSVRS